MYIYVQRVAILDEFEQIQVFGLQRRKPVRFSYKDCGRDYFKRYIEIAVTLIYTV